MDKIGISGRIPPSTLSTNQPLIFENASTNWPCDKYVSDSSGTARQLLRRGTKPREGVVQSQLDGRSKARLEVKDLIQ